LNWNRPDTAFEQYGDEPGRPIHDPLIQGDGIHPSAAGQRPAHGLLATEIVTLVRA
jgi:hypothetical protein